MAFFPISNQADAEVWALRNIFIKWIWVKDFFYNINLKISAKYQPFCSVGKELENLFE